MFEDPKTGKVVNEIQKVNYSHDALIDLIISNPAIDQKELARRFGYSQGWVSRMIASDSFQARFGERKEELVDPILRHSIEEQFRGIVLQSIEILRAKLDANPSDTLALEVMKHGSKALGYGARIHVTGDIEHKHSLVRVLAGLPSDPQPQELLMEKTG